MFLTRTTLRIAVGLGALAFLTAAAPEPAGIWTGPMVSDTPATLRGAEVLDVDGLKSLMARHPLLIDSGPADRKPENLSAGTLWKPTHRSIPGAVWFPGAGRGDLEPAKVAALMARIHDLSGGDKSTPIVSYCRPRCWGSWNVAKRLVEAGYKALYWFPAGINGWQERYETVSVEPQPGWAPPD